MSTEIDILPPEVDLNASSAFLYSDGKPMAETQEHTLQMLTALVALRWHFRNDPRRYLIGSMFVYYSDSMGQQRVAPDIFVVRGVAKKRRQSYFVAKEGKAPEMVIEFTSKKTKRLDCSNKPKIYAWLGVREFFMFDPFGDYLDPRLIGHVLVDGKYVPLEMTQPRLHSEVLGLDLALDGDDLRFYDPQTAKRLLTHEEAQKELEHQIVARQIAEAQAQRELAARQTAEAELARLREELARKQKT